MPRWDWRWNDWRGFSAKKTAGFDAGGKNLFLRGEQMHKDILRHEDVTLMTGTVFMALSTLSSERIYIAEV